MTRILREYLELERLMLILDEEESRAADSLRDAMDALWYRLDAAERRLLNERAIGRVTSLEEISLPASDELFGAPPAPPPSRPLPEHGIGGWAEAA